MYVRIDVTRVGIYEFYIRLLFRKLNLNNYKTSISLFIH